MKSENVKVSGYVKHLISSTARFLPSWKRYPLRNSTKKQCSLSMQRATQSHPQPQKPHTEERNLNSKKQDRMRWGREGMRQWRLSLEEEQKAGIIRCREKKSTYENVHKKTLPHPAKFRSNKEKLNQSVLQERTEGECRCYIVVVVVVLTAQCMVQLSTMKCVW